MYFYILIALGALVLWYVRSNKALPIPQLKAYATNAIAPHVLIYLDPDRVVIVTGSARGLGKAVAKEFANYGAKFRIILIDVIEATLRETEREFSDLFGTDNMHAVVGDLSNKEFCKSVIDETISKYGKLDVLYINHGIMPANPIEQLSIETIEKVMAVNFMSFVYLVKNALPYIRASKGMYGVTSSMAGFFDVLRMEEKKYGASVTVVCPGAMKTDMARGDLSKSPIKVHLPEDLAPGIVNAVVSRKRDHYTDVALRLGGTVRALFPQLVDNILGPLSAQLADK